MIETSQKRIVDYIHSTINQINNKTKPTTSWGYTIFKHAISVKVLSNSKHYEVDYEEHEQLRGTVIINCRHWRRQYTKSVILTILEIEQDNTLNSPNYIDIEEDNVHVLKLYITLPEPSWHGKYQSWSITQFK